MIIKAVPKMLLMAEVFERCKREILQMPLNNF
jgi:hypothetical protein